MTATNSIPFSQPPLESSRLDEKNRKALVNRQPPSAPKFVVGKPNVLNRELFLERVKQVLDTAIHTNDGPFVRQLEGLVQELLAVPYCLAVANATQALELLLESVAIDGEVIVPSFTFVATVHAVVRSNLTPVFCDVDSRGLIDCDHLEQLISSRTRCILPVNVYGNVCDISRLKEIADKHKLALIYDSAHALGVKTGGLAVGGFGDAEVFSLHATKFISGFEGGLITTRSPELAASLKMARNFGFVDYDAVESMGTNAKLSEIQAAMALTNLECMPEIIAHNRQIFDIYKQALQPPLYLIEPSPAEESNFQYVPVRCPAAFRDAIVKSLMADGILARRYFFPGVHRMKAYQHMQVVLPQTDILANSVICLPTGRAISTDDAQLIASAANVAAAAAQKSITF